MKKSLFVFVLSFFSPLLFSLSFDEVKALPSKKTDFYGGSFSHNLLEKVRPLEGNAKQFISDYDNYYEYKNHELTPQEKDFFTVYFSYLPKKFQDCFLDHVYAIYFVEGMWYGGLTDFIYDENQNTYCIVYFNIDTFYYVLDDWLELRDNSIFKKTDDNNKIKVECSKEWRAFLHALIHESAHVYDYVNKVTPYLESFDGSLKTNNVYYQYWQTKVQPVNKYNNKLLSQFSYYYFGKQISFSKAKPLIEYLSKTPFSTLYGAKNFMDDFAETVTFYYLKYAFGLDYKITCIQKGKAKATYSLSANKNVSVWNELCRRVTE